MPITTNSVVLQDSPNPLTEFRDIVFPASAPGARLLTAKPNWPALRWTDDATVDGRDLYYIPSTFREPPRGAAPRKRRSDVLKCVGVVLDDIGTKIPLERVASLLPPSFIIETSAGNFQWTYLFNEPQDPGVVDAIYEGIKAAGLSDAGTARIMQPFRVPGSINTKPGANNFEAVWTLPEGAADVVIDYPPETIVSGLGITPSAPAPLGEVVPLPAGARDTVFDWLYERGLILSAAHATGFHDMECPWADEHSEGGGKAGYKIGRPGAFKCMHDHCAGRGLTALVSWIKAQDPQADVRIDTTDRDAAQAASIGELGATMATLLPADEIADTIAQNVERERVEFLELQAEAHEATRRAEAFAPGNAYVLPAGASLPRRDWLMPPCYLRGEVSAVVGTGGTGKSLLVLAEAVSLASGKAIIPGRVPTGQYRVAYFTAEDSLDEVARRLVVLCKLHDITQAELGDRLFIRALRGHRIVTIDRGGTSVVVNREFVTTAVDFLKRIEADAVIFDPLAALNGGVENSNDSMNRVIDGMRDIATGAKVASRFPHHMRKGGDGVEASRGGGALIDGVRQADALVKMTPEQGRALNVRPAAVKWHFGIVDGKQNYTEPSDDQWFERVPGDVGNGNATHVSDRAPAIRAMAVRPFGVSRDVAVAIHAYLTTNGAQRESSQATEWFGWKVAELAGVPMAVPRDVDAKRQINRVLALLVLHGIIVKAVADFRQSNRATVELMAYKAGALPASDWAGVI